MDGTPFSWYPINIYCTLFILKKKKKFLNPDFSIDDLDLPIAVERDPVLA